MDNYIMLDGKKIELSEETAKNFRKQFEPVHVPRHGDVVWYKNSPHPEHRRLLLRQDGNLAAYYENGTTGSAYVTSEDFETKSSGVYPIYTFKYNIFD